MKKSKKNISFIMSVLIILFFFFQSSFFVYATDTSHGGGGSSRGDDESKESNGSTIKDKFYSVESKFELAITYLCSQLGALTDGNFSQYCSNKDRLAELEGFSSIDEIYGHYVKEEKDNSGNITSFTYDEKLVSYIKQALREYSEETNGYWLIPTTSINAVDVSRFDNLKAYNTLVNLINNHGIIACQTNDYTSSKTYSGIIAADFSEFISSDYNLVCINDLGYDPYNATTAMTIEVYDSSWENVGNIPKYVFDKDEISSNITDGHESYNGSARNYNKYYVDYPKYHEGYLYRLSETYNYTAQYYGMLISKDGCRLRVFKSENAMKAYDTETRTVYFGKDFYEKDPVDITITIDDLDKYLNTDFDKYFGELKDTIMSQGSNLSEADIEKLTDSILGKLTDIDNSIGEVGDSVKDTNNLLSQILAILENLDKNVSGILANIDNKVTSTLDFSGIEERLDTIILSLGVISGQLDDMTAEEIENKTDDALKEMQDEFSEIGDMAKTKFPLSLPWDIFGMLKMLSGGAAGGGEAAPETVSLLLDSETDTFVHTMSLYGDNGIALYSSENTDSSQGGGYLPSMELSIDSLRGTDSGGHISSGGHEHGGGGHSRWGAWLSESGAPIFYIPVEFSQSMEIGGLLIIDLSGFEVLHNIGRIMFTVIFCMNLIHLTFKAIAAGKDVLEW